MITLEPKNHSLNRFHALIVYSVLVIITGIVLMSLAYYPFVNIRYTVAGGMILSSIFAFITAYKCRPFQVPTKYHALHAGGFMIYGLLLILMAKNIQQFSHITTIFLLYYGFVEIIFCLEILMMKQNLMMQTIFFRLIIGLVILTGAATILSTSYIDQNMAVISAGVVFIISGINLILFRTILKVLVKSF
jgi:hypothetical protein